MKKYIIGLIAAVAMLSSSALSNTLADTSLMDIESLLDVKVSTAAKYQQTIRCAPASVTVITCDEIKDYGWLNVYEALSSQAGFFGRNDRNYNYIGVRGFERPTSYNNTILQLIDGHMINESIYFSPFFANDFSFDINSVERKKSSGSGSSLYGTSAMFGVINIITKPAKNIDGVRASFNIGSWKNTQGTITAGKQFSEDFSLVVSGKYGYIRGEDLYYKEYDTDSTNHGIAEGLDWERFLGGSVNLKLCDINFSTYYSKRKKGIPTGAWEIIFNDSRIQTMDERAFAEVKANREISSSLSIMGRAYYDYYFYQGYYPYGDGNEGMQMDYTKGYTFGAELQGIYDFSPSLRITGGLEFKRNFFAELYAIVPGEYEVKQNYPYNVISGYFQGQWQVFEQLNITLGLRADNYEKDESSVNPRLAVAYYLCDNTTIKYVLGSAFRVANIYEKYYSDGLSQKGNPDLKPERILTHEIIWNQDVFSGLSVSTSLYYYFMNDLIDQIRDTTVEIMQLQFHNRDKVHAYGIESQLNYKALNFFSGYISYAFQITKDELTGEKLTNSPSHILKIGGMFRIFDEFRAGASMVWESGRRTLYSDEGTLIYGNTPPYFLANFICSYRTSFPEHSEFSFLNNLTILFRLNNLFDTIYYLPGGLEHIQHSIEQNRRNFMLELCVAI
jgi:iron complex outermembrane receptor protein